MKYLSTLKLLCWEDIKCTMLLMLSFLPSIAVRARKKNVWLIVERINNAEDNGWIFYQWMKSNHSERHVYFLLDKRAKNFDCNDKQMIAWGSFKHYVYYLASDIQIKTMFNTARPSQRICCYYEDYLRKPLKFVYLRHGISASGVEHHTYQLQKARIFICGAKPEYDFVKKYAGYPEGYVQYTGFARFDDLLSQQTDGKFVLIMPTWRRYIEDYTCTNEQNTQRFINSSYFQHIHSLLSNTELVDFVLSIGYKIKFSIHAQFKKYLHLFKDIDPRIEIIDGKPTVHELLMSTSLLITDYSSVFFDVAYMRKPMIFYQFDYTEFREKHFSEGYFSFERDGMGPVVDTEEALLTTLRSYYDGEKIANKPEYIERCDKFFPIHDNKNCERIYQAVINIEKE